MMDKERGDKRLEAYHHHRAAVSRGRARAESREREGEMLGVACVSPLFLVGC